VQQGQVSEIFAAGIIGAIGLAATGFCCRRLISTFANKNAPRELTILNADTPPLLRGV
jgi:hypothetical protein